jgi:hypothetical protein
VAAVAQEDADGVEDHGEVVWHGCGGGIPRGIGRGGGIGSRHVIVYNGPSERKSRIIF